MCGNKITYKQFMKFSKANIINELNYPEKLSMCNPVVLNVKFKCFRQTVCLKITKKLNSSFKYFNSILDKC